MRKTLKRIGIGILTAAVVVSNMPAGVVYVKAETKPAVQGESDADYESDYHNAKAKVASPSNATAAGSTAGNNGTEAGSESTAGNNGTGNAADTASTSGAGIDVNPVQGTELDEEYVYEAEAYFKEDGVQEDGDVKFCDMQPGETITVPVSDKSLPEGNYVISVRSNGSRIAYPVYVDGIPVGIIRRSGTEWGAADLTEDTLEAVIHLTGSEKITIKAPANKNGSDGFSYYGKVDAILLTPTEESPETAEPLGEIVLHSEDWYFGDTDGSGGVNLRPQDGMELFILGRDGFSEEETPYQMKVQTGGFHREYTVSVNGKKKGSFIHAGESGDWEPCGTGEETLENVLKLKAGDVLTIYAAEGWGVVGDITLVRQEEQSPADFEGTDTETGIRVSAAGSVVPEGSVLSVKTPDEAKIKAILEEKGIDSTKGSFYEIRLFDENGNEIKALSGTVTVEIPIPDSYQVNAVTFCQITDAGEYREVQGTIENGFVVLETDSLGIFGILDTRVQEAGSYVYEAETYYENSQGIWQDGGVTFCDMQLGEKIVIPVSDQNLPEGNYTLSLSSNGTRTGYIFYVNGVPAGVIKRNASGWNAVDLTEDTYQGVLYLKPGDEISIEAPKNKWEDDGMLFGKLDWVMLKATEEKPETPEVMDKVVLHSEDWYFGKTDDAGGVNLRPEDQIDYLIRREDGFDETARSYQMTVRAGGFRTQYTILVNGETIGSLNRTNTEWGELTDSRFQQIVTLKAGDVLTIYAAESWGTVADVTLEMLKEQEPYEAVDEKSGVKISAEPGVVPEHTILTVEEPDAETVESACQSYGLDSSKGTFYQILLKDSEGNPAELLGQVKITMPVPETYNPNGIMVCRITEDGSLVQIPVTIENETVSILTQEHGTDLSASSVEYCGNFLQRKRGGSRQSGWTDSQRFYHSSLQKIGGRFSILALCRNLCAACCTAAGTEYGAGCFDGISSFQVSKRVSVKRNLHETVDFCYAL